MKIKQTSMKIHLTTLQNESRTCAMTEPVAGRKPVLALLMRLLWVAALGLPAFGAQAAAVFTSLHSFTVFPNGANPNGLVQGSDGNFYGTTEQGGTNGAGTVFQISTNGALTSLYSFTGGNDGAGPGAGLVPGSDGNLYGTTSGFDPVSGEPGGFGTVFKISINGALTSLYSFTGGNDGAYPRAGLVQGSDGYFYGTTLQGGMNGEGTVFKISINGALTSLYSFTARNYHHGIYDNNDGALPYAGLVQGSDGYFYGTTGYGGTNNEGTVFKISTNGALTSLYTFTGTNDGANPFAGLVQGSDGYFYGTTWGGGTNNEGTVFKISTNGGLTSLYSFPGGNDGADPQGGLVQGSDGNLYGTTQNGGTNGAGTVFTISTNGVLATLYSFGSGSDGANPEAALVQGRDGYFYGTTYDGGTNGAGTVFTISTNGALTSLYSFGSVQDTNGFPLDGAYPAAALVQGRDGYFYGTTEGGGTNGAGTVFKISINGALTSLYSFGSVQDTNGFPLDGAYPAAALVQGRDGYFYGTTSGFDISTGSGYGYGTVFKISTNGALTSLYSFFNGGGIRPSGLVQGSDGNFFGTTEYSYPGGLVSGPHGGGTVFKISSSGALTTLYSFTGTNDGMFPRAGLVQGSDGYFYGTTEYNDSANLPGTFSGAGTVFKISTNGVLTTLYAFGTVTNADGASLDGANPYASLVQGSDGSFYGTTYQGGTNGVGTVFRLTIVPQPQLTIIPSGPYVILTWPTNYNGFTLQCTTNLGSSAVWSTNSSPPVVIAGENVVISTASGKQQFYRLSH